MPVSKPPTLAELQAAADTANASLAAARRELDQARLAVYSAADAYYQAVLAVTTPLPAAKAAATTVPPIDAASARLDQALAAYEQLRRDLGLN